MSSYLYRGPQSPREDSYSTFNNANPLSPTRNSNSRGAAMASTGGEVRGGLTRRFTTNALPSLSPIGQQRLQAVGDNAMTLGYSRFAPSERKIRHIEALLEQQRRIEAELEQVDDDTRREIEEGLRHERAVNQFIAQSEPTTPPEYQDTFPTVVTRPNRYSITSLTSPSNVVNRPHRSSTHLTSPSAGFARPYTSHVPLGYPSQSVPGSRRHSDDEDENEYVFDYDTPIGRAGANPNRISLPVTSQDRKRTAADLSAALGPLNTTSFLFDEEERPANRASQLSANPSSPDTKAFLEVQHTADGFPKLIRREDNSEPILSGSSAALDLAPSQQNPTVDHPSNDRLAGRRHRISLPPTALSSNGTIAPLNSILAAPNEIKPVAKNRRSLEVKFSAETKRPSLMASNPNTVPNGNAKSMSSYSTNDIPTLKSIKNDHSGSNATTSSQAKPTGTAESVLLESNQGHSTAPNSNRQSHDFTSSQPHFMGLNGHRQSLDLTADTKALDKRDAFGSVQSGLQGNAAPFGPPHDTPVQQFVPPNMPFGAPPFYGSYGLPILNNSFNSMNLNGTGYGLPNQWPGQGVAYGQAGLNGFQPQTPSRNPISPANRVQRVSPPTTHNKLEADDIYNSIGISQLQGQIYSLCKDQHGCRFLQRKLDERREEDVDLVFNEVKDHFTELMTDPFGNYLCQRLLEHTNNDQRTALIKNASPSMTNIAVNQHGTRALQRMIEFINTKEQTELLIIALGNDVVQLIQDLNGNHVIQKCLNHLSSEDAEFIFTAVGANCVVVGTHRHGCCVLQRCVDHASGLQKGRLVDCIIENALSLVQDPFGNYVVQYVLDLSEPCFTQPLCHALMGHVAYLSKQKFSSNVIEKCIRCADKDTKRMFVQEIMVPIELEKLLRDSFANYVVQTAIDHCPEDSKAMFVENIRPILPSIRNTPHGRRIAGKIQDYDFPGNTNWIPGNPKNVSLPPASNSRSNRMGMVGAPDQWPMTMDNSAALNGTNGNTASATTAQIAPNFGMFGDGMHYQQYGFPGNPYNNAGGMGGAPYGPF